MTDNPFQGSTVNAKWEGEGANNTLRIKRFHPLQLGMVLGVMYALVSLIVAPILLLAVAMGNTPGAGLLVIILLPLIYGIIGFVSGVLGGFVYNICAKLVGGIAVDVA